MSDKKRIMTGLIEFILRQAGPVTRVEHSLEHFPIDLFVKAKSILHLRLLDPSREFIVANRHLLVNFEWHLYQPVRCLALEPIPESLDTIQRVVIMVSADQNIGV